MLSRYLQDLEGSRSTLLSAIGTPDDLTLVRPRGNIGDELIHAGTKQLLSGLSVREVSIADIRACDGDTVLLGGSGGWCGPYHGLPERLALLEERFNRVVVMPSSFDTTVEPVREALSKSRALVFARERVSYEQIRDLCNAGIAFDCAFFFDFVPYRQPGEGVLLAFRTDRESAFQTVPPGNQDISVSCRALDAWLQTIARHETIRTDRAHVLVAGALLGKRVEYLASSYHKLPAIVDYSLRDFPVSKLPDAWLRALCDSSHQLTETEHLRVLAEHIASLFTKGSAFLLAGDNAIGEFSLQGRRRVPFLEREGVYWGLPKDDETAIRELERMRQTGVSFAVFPWTTFWWWDFYAGFTTYMRSTYPCLVDNDSLVAFDITTSPQEVRARAAIPRPKRSEVLM